MILEIFLRPALSVWPARCGGSVPGCGAEAAPAVITTACVDNLPALSLQDYSLPPTWRIAVTAFLIQPWLLCRAPVPLIRSRERLITISASVCVDSWMTTGWNIRIYIPLKDKFNTNATGLNSPLLLFFTPPPPASILCCGRIVFSLQSHSD